MTWSEAIDLLPEGVLVVGRDGVVVHANPEAEQILDRSRPDLVGRTFPTDFAGTAAEIESGSESFTWEHPAQGRREIAFRQSAPSAATGSFLVVLRDVTAERQQTRRLAAIAQTAARHRSVGSIQATLDALAGEIVQADAVSGVQIFTVDSGLQQLQVMGSAGFRHRDDFFDRLLACQRLGADLRQFEAMRTQQPVVVAHRSERVMTDPAWAPFHDYYRDIRWDSFACIPIVIRGESEGVLNIFGAPGQEIDQRMLDFLVSMADQAAVAIEYAVLLQKERDAARQTERARLAADLHDSIVQHVFSVGMQAESIKLISERGLPATEITPLVDEILSLSRTVLADLRTMVRDLRPRESSLRRLEATVRETAASTARRSSLTVDLQTDLGTDVLMLNGSLAEDVHRIVTEALHNVVKHAEAHAVTVRMRVEERTLLVTVTDDGRGLGLDRSGASESAGLGLESMRERAQRWGGSLTIGDGAIADGTSLRVSIPLPDQGPSREPGSAAVAAPGTGPQAR